MPEGTVAPILPSRDLDATVAFYGPLGFTVVARHTPPDPYLILRREGIELHFIHVPDLDPAASLAGAYLRVRHVDPLHDEWARVLHWTPSRPRLHPPEDKPWGMREFAMIDPDGSVLRVGTRVA